MTVAEQTQTASSDVQDWLDCERERRHLEAELKRVVTVQEKARQRVMERWSMEGINREVVDGQTLHLRRKVYPKVQNKYAVAQALIKEGLTDLVTVDDKMFAMWATTKEEMGDALPESIAPYMGEAFERFDLVVKLKGGINP